MQWAKIWELYGGYLPTSRQTRESFLDKAREKVAYYQPKIEEIFGVDLGKIAVKEFKEWFKDYCQRKFDEAIKGHESETGEKSSKLDRFLLCSPISIASYIAKPLCCLLESFRGTEAMFNNSNIYFPFSFSNRFLDPNMKRRTQRLDRTIVHELSHSLWNSLGGNDHMMVQKLWSEGFATYCEQVHLRELYPQDCYLSRNNHGVYSQGKRKIELVVKKYGLEVVPQIPKRWQEFNEQIN